MNDPRGWFSLRLTVRCGRFRRIVRFPPRSHRRLIVAATFLLPVGYVVGAVPTMLAMQRLGIENHPVFDTLFQIIYAPLIWLSDHVDIAEWFFQTEHDLIKRVFGE
jgi:hypothetical protein